MPERRLGSFVMSSAVLLVAASFLLFAVSAGRSDEEESMRSVSMFSSSDGLSVGSKVTIAGVAVGAVTSIKLDRRSGLSMVTFTRPGSLILPADSSVSIEGGGPTGSSNLSIDPGHSERALEVGTTITRSVPASSLEDEIGNFIFGDGGLGGSE